jgi:hypothetical protein
MKSVIEEMKNPNTDQRLVKYLLGDLLDEEREQIERQYLADKDFFDELLAIEDDLMDEYVSGELSAGARRQFEQHLLKTPAQREKLKYAQILRERMPARKPMRTAQEISSAAERSSWFSFFTTRKFVPALALAFAVMLVVGGAWLFVRIRHLQNEVGQMQAERAAAQDRERELQEELTHEQQENEALLRQLQQEREIITTQNSKEPTKGEPQSALQIATFTLVPTSIRGGGGAEFVVAPNVEVVQLRVSVAENYPNYRAELQTADGESVYTLSNLKARPAAKGRWLFLRVPQSRLQKRDYVLKVSGLARGGEFEDAGFYAFRITKK